MLVEPVVQMTYAPISPTIWNPVWTTSPRMHNSVPYDKGTPLYQESLIALHRGKCNLSEKSSPHSRMKT